MSESEFESRVTRLLKKVAAQEEFYCISSHPPPPPRTHTFRGDKTFLSGISESERQNLQADFFPEFFFFFVEVD